jgi:bla regulator protein blaR1
MNDLGQSNFLQALGWAVLNSLWQLALLWVLYQVIMGIYKGARPSHKSSLASGLLITGFAWFLYTFLSIYSNASSHDDVMAAGLVSVEGNEQLNAWLYKTLPIASVVYLLLLIFPLLHFIRNYRFVQVIRNYGLSKADVEWRMFVKRVAAQMGIRKPVHIWVSELVTSPVTIGYLKPIILVPLAAINHLTPKQLEAVLLHELAHIRRMDYFVNLIIKFIQVVLYYNPFVKAFVKIIEREREKSCDEMVIQFQYDPHGYASALLVLEKNNHFPKPLAVAAAGKKHDLLHRIEWIMGVQKKPVISFNKLAGVFAGLLCIIALNAVIILSKPSMAGKSSVSFANLDLSSPFYFFTNDDEGEQDIELDPTGSPVELKNATIVTHAKPEVKEAKPAMANHATPVADAETNYSRALTPHPFASNVAYKELPDIPELTREQEAQVKEAMKASQQVIQEGHWKTVESSLAEVFTMQQKEELKARYQKEMCKVDWKNWEEKLRTATAYDRIDWERINIELGKAVSNIRLDSLQRAYTKVFTDLSQLEKQLNQLDLDGIPDSDVSLEEVVQKKLDLQKAIHKVKAAKSKKVVHL